MENESYVKMLGALMIDGRNPQRNTATMKNAVFLYGHRPSTCDELWYLSPYEFFVYWSVGLADFARAPEYDNDDMPAILTCSGWQKFRSKDCSDSSHLIAGEDYVLKEWDPERHHSWAPVEDNEYTKQYRNDWVFRRNRRPLDPTFDKCPMPRRGADEQNRTAAIILTYFHPFTLDPQLGSTHVPFLGDLCDSGKSWHDTMLRWFNGHLLCEETKRYVQNFLVVTRIRPDEEDDLHSDDQFSDEELMVGAHNFSKVV